VLCLYLLVGLFFAFTYIAIQNLGGAPFFSNGAAATLVALGLLQFVTMTTVGYGDFTARTKSRTHAGSERGAARSDLPRHGRRGDRQPSGQPRRLPK
jgi:type IV secretory pathway TrbL component